MKININDLPTRKDVLQWYLEMNSAGTPHTKEEINKAYIYNASTNSKRGEGFRKFQ